MEKLIVNFGTAQYALCATVQLRCSIASHLREMMTESTTTSWNFKNKLF